jgi:hypothetical protein
MSFALFSPIESITFTGNMPECVVTLYTLFEDEKELLQRLEELGLLRVIFGSDEATCWNDDVLSLLRRHGRNTSLTFLA